MSVELILLLFSVGLFGIGLYAILAKRNAIKILIAIEIMTIAINGVFIAVGTNLEAGKALGLSRVFPLISMAIGAAVMALGLALVVNNYRHANSVDTDKMSILKR